MSARAYLQCPAPVLAVCGFSGSGKTTLLEAAIPRLIDRGLSIAVVKHDAHGFHVDQAGKDSDRLFRAGATVALRGPGEQFQRRGAAAALSIAATVCDLGQDHDLVLVEGHKDTPLPKVWLRDAHGSEPPPEVTEIAADLAWDSARVEAFMSYLDSWLPQAWSNRPMYGALLIGGQSSRMGAPKQLLEVRGKPMGVIVADALRHGGACQQVVVVGAGAIPKALEDLPRLADAPGFSGPVGGALSAHRWAGSVAWVVAACDHPHVTSPDIDWLVAQRQPGTWAIVPLQSDASPCPTLALYEPQALHWLERMALEGAHERFSLSKLLDHPRTKLLKAPSECQKAWQDIDTPEQMQSLRDSTDFARSSTKAHTGEEER